MQLKSILFPLLLLCASTSALSEPWIYYDIRNSRNQFLLENHPDRSAWMDNEGNAKFCEKSSDMLCFKVNTFQFAIPKKSLDVGAEWQHDGISYKLAEKGRLDLLGKSYLVHFIDSKFEKYQMRFLFSIESGLIAITTVDPTPGLFLLLEGACGFGAPSSCRGSQ
jgi:hypothetical protein